jgi:glycosyltransferase involved in cell wall biosynthesis
MNKQFLSIVMPVFNEEGVVEKTIREFHGKVLLNFEKWELIVVDDCSTDATPQILERLKNEIGISVLRNERNMGHGPSLVKAYRHASGDLVFHTDSDYQIEAQEFYKLFGRIVENDLVIGRRVKRSDPLHRLILTSLVRILIFLFFRVAVYDSNSPFRIARRGLLDKFLGLISDDFSVPSIAMCIFAKRNNYRVEEVEVSHQPRLTGRVALIKFRLIVFCVRSMMQLLSTRFKRNA